MLIKLWDFQGYECVRTMHGEFEFRLHVNRNCIFESIFLQSSKVEVCCQLLFYCVDRITSTQYITNILQNTNFFVLKMLKIDNLYSECLCGLV